MNTTHASPQRIVVVHGPIGRDLADLLHHSGLEAIVDDGDITIWAPAAGNVSDDELAVSVRRSLLDGAIAAGGYDPLLRRAWVRAAFDGYGTWREP